MHVNVNKRTGPYMNLHDQDLPLTCIGMDMILGCKLFYVPSGDHILVHSDQVLDRCTAYSCTLHKINMYNVLMYSCTLHNIYVDEQHTHVPYTSYIYVQYNNVPYTTYIYSMLMYPIQHIYVQYTHVPYTTYIYRCTVYSCTLHNI